MKEKKKKGEILHVTVDDGCHTAHGSQLMGSAVSGMQREAAVVICSFPLLQTCRHKIRIFLFKALKSIFYGEPHLSSITVRLTE